MSSNSSIPDAAVRPILGESLDALRREVPELHAELRRKLAAWSVEIAIEDERFVMRAAPDRIELTDGEAIARVRASKQALVALIDAQHTLADAVRAGAVALFAPAAALGDLHDALDAYLHGAARCSAFPGLLARFRRLCAATPGGRERR